MSLFMVGRLKCDRAGCTKDTGLRELEFRSFESEVYLPEGWVGERGKTYCSGECAIASRPAMSAAAYPAYKLNPGVTVEVEKPISNAETLTAAEQVVAAELIPEQEEFRRLSGLKPIAQAHNAPMVTPSSTRPPYNYESAAGQFFPKASVGISIQGNQPSDLVKTSVVVEAQTNTLEEQTKRIVQLFKEETKGIALNIQEGMTGLTRLRTSMEVPANEREPVGGTAFKYPTEHGLFERIKAMELGADLAASEIFKLGVPKPIVDRMIKQGYFEKVVKPQWAFVAKESMLQFALALKKVESLVASLLTTDVLTVGNDILILQRIQEILTRIAVSVMPQIVGALEVLRDVPTPETTPTLETQATPELPPASEK